jgi:poly(A) polymerase
VQKHLQQGMKFYPAFHAAMGDVFRQQKKSLIIPRRLITVMRGIWTTQFRIAQLQRNYKNIFKLFHHPRFRAAYDFLLVRCEVDETMREVCSWWTQFQDVDEPEKHKMIQELAGRVRRRPNSNKKT